jgi:adenylate cyclase
MSIEADSGWPIADLRDCCEGEIPGVLATCAADGTPNVSYLSQVEYLDDSHVALSFQFFNTTRRNILANPDALLLMVHPRTAAMFRVGLRYLRTETEGALFERMRAKLAGIAAHEHMDGIFKLRGADIYRITCWETVPGKPLPKTQPPRQLLSALRRTLERMATAPALAALFDVLLSSLHSEFGIDHAQLLMLDESGRKLYAVASRGYEQSGVGAEIPLGTGVIGAAAASRTAIRIGYSNSEYAYGRALRDAILKSGPADRIEVEIAPAGLAEPRSQLAVPILIGGDRLLGVLFVESLQERRFSYDDEDALAGIAAQLALGMRLLQAAEVAIEEPAVEVAEPAVPQGPQGPPMAVRYFAENNSIFLGDDYLIKGVAGAILWTLLRDHVASGRTRFSNRELRVDTRIGLPDLFDNLEARLILLQRRLDEHQACVRIEKCGRGRFHLNVNRPLQLVAH